MFVERLYGTNANHILPTLPRGWRWANEFETLAWYDIRDIRQVRVGGTDDDPWTDLALPYPYFCEICGTDNDEFHTEDECYK